MTSFIVDHASSFRSSSRAPLTDMILDRIPAELANDSSAKCENVITPREYYEFTHFTDATMTDQEIVELPKGWVVGGDGGIPAISATRTRLRSSCKNRPSMKVLICSAYAGVLEHRRAEPDSTPMLGGNDMRRLQQQHAGQEQREEDGRGDLPCRSRFAVRGADLDGQRAQDVPGDSRWP